MNYADFQFLKFDHKPNGVLLITINRPEVMNATNGRLHWELTKIWGVVNDDAKTKVAVITGAGDQAFSAGGDLEWVANMVGNPKEIANTMTEASDVVYNMMACDKPIISAINGVAVGAGLAVAFLADISIMAEEAKITDGHVKIGVAAGRKGLIASAGNDGNFGLGIVVDDAPDLGQLPMQAGIGGVHHLGAVDGDQQHAIGFVVELEELKVSVVHLEAP